MRISAKARYGLATMIYLVVRHPYQSKFTVSEVSDSLKISKIYLEQVFTQLRKAGIVQATNGPQGGYSLTRSPEEITVFEVLDAAETALFEETSETVTEGSAFIERAMRENVFTPLDDAVKSMLSGVTLAQLAEKASGYNDTGYMYYL